jgi:hypothetical protein
MDGHDPVVMRAINIVVERHSTDDWWALPAQKRVQAIYDEVRRLDAKTPKASVRTLVAAKLAVA